MADRVKTGSFQGLHSLTPLGAEKPRVTMVGDTCIAEHVGFALASVTARAGGAAATKKALAKIINQPAPEAGQFVGGDIAAFWTGPEQWFLQAPFASHEDIENFCGASFAGHASVVEITDGWCRFVLSGPHILRILSLLCAIDIRQFAPGAAMRTSIEHLGCFVLRVAEDEIQILGPRSSAGSLHHALCAAAKSAPF